MKNKNYDYLNRCRKSFQQNSTPIYDKNSPESGHRGNLPQHNKGHTQQTQQTLHSMVKNRKYFLSDQKQGKNVHTHYYYST